jgi:hypothetical protein
MEAPIGVEDHYTLKCLHTVSVIDEDFVLVHQKNAYPSLLYAFRWEMP